MKVRKWEQTSLTICVDWVYTYFLLLSWEGNSLSGSLLTDSDGLHLTPAGNRVVLDEFLKVLESMPSLKANTMPFDFPEHSEVQADNPSVTFQPKALKDTCMLPFLSLSASLLLKTPFLCGLLIEVLHLLVWTVKSHVWGVIFLWYVVLCRIASMNHVMASYQGVKDKDPRFKCGSLQYGSVFCFVIGRFEKLRCQNRFYGRWLLWTLETKGSWISSWWGTDWHFDAFCLHFRS